MTVTAKSDSYLNILKTHIAKYPKHKIEDLYKLTYQSEFAGGHLIKDETSHLNHLSLEMELTSGLPFKGIEWIDAHLCRVYLDELYYHIKATTLNRMVLHTSKQNQGNIFGLEKRLTILKFLSKSLDTDNYLQKMKHQNYPLVSHSDLYKNAYNPHYRIISANFGHYFEIITKIDQLLNIKHNAIIAIDGMSGSGKSMLTQMLSELFEADIIHMDHFFPKDSESQKYNLEVNHINIDSSRFNEEVLNRLDLPSFEYQPYDCTTGSYLPKIAINRNKPTIIEGSYSSAELFRTFYDYKSFLTCDSTRQFERLKKRNPEIDNQTISLWISYENTYFQLHHSIENANIVIDTTEMFF
jgi:uridine kinase